MYVRTHACATSPLRTLLDSQTPHMKQNACVCEPKTHAWATLQNACVSDPVTRRSPGNPRHHWFTKKKVILPVQTTWQLGECGHTRRKRVVTHRWFCVMFWNINFVGEWQMCQSFLYILFVFVRPKGLPPTMQGLDSDFVRNHRRGSRVELSWLAVLALRKDCSIERRFKSSRSSTRNFSGFPHSCSKFLTMELSGAYSLSGGLEKKNRTKKIKH